MSERKVTVYTTRDALLVIFQELDDLRSALADNGHAGVAGDILEAQKCINSAFSHHPNLDEPLFPEVPHV